MRNRTSLNRFAAGMLLMLLVLVVDNAEDVRAQISTRGKNFWLAFPINAQPEKNTGLVIGVVVTGNPGTEGVVSVPGRAYSRQFALDGSGTAYIRLDSSYQVISSEEVETLGVNVRSESDISVVAMSARKASTDSYLVLPVSSLGTSYRAAGYEAMLGSGDTFTSFFSIVATKPGTTIKITPTASTKMGKKAGSMFEALLNEGEVYQVLGEKGGGPVSDLTGSLVVSDKPVAFITGHRCAQVPRDVMFCDVLLEMESPISKWGNEFVLGLFRDRSEFAYRVIADQDGTIVTVNGEEIATLQAGKHYENNHAGKAMHIKTSKPALVAQYAQSSDADEMKIGDPFMILAEPTARFATEYEVLPPTRGDWVHYVTIVTRNEFTNGIILNDHPISPIHFQKVGSSGYSIGTHTIVAGRSRLHSTEPFGVITYGFGAGNDNYDSYGHPASRLGSSAEGTRPVKQDSNDR